MVYNVNVRTKQIIKERLKMNVTELIQQLQDFKEKHGDLKVCVDGEYTLNINKGVLFSDETEDVCLISSQYEDEEDDEEDWE